MFNKKEWLKAALNKKAWKHMLSGFVSLRSSKLELQGQSYKKLIPAWDNTLLLQSF
jgi:hypothetical protein